MEFSPQEHVPIIYQWITWIKRWTFRHDNQVKIGTHTAILVVNNNVIWNYDTLRYATSSQFNVSIIPHIHNLQCANLWKEHNRICCKFISVLDIWNYAWPFFILLEMIGETRPRLFNIVKLSLQKIWQFKGIGRHGIKYWTNVHRKFHYQQSHSMSSMA